MNNTSRNFEKFLFTSLKVSGALMICLGTGLLLGSLTSASSLDQMASTSLTTDETVVYTSSSTSSGTNYDTSNTTIKPSITFTTIPPTTVTASFYVALEVYSVGYVKLSVRGLDHNNSILLEPSSHSLNSFKFFVPFEQLSVGRYELEAQGLLSDGTMIKAVGSKFEIPVTTNVVDTTTGTSVEDPVVDPFVSTDSLQTDTTNVTNTDPITSVNETSIPVSSVIAPTGITSTTSTSSISTTTSTTTIVSTTTPTLKLVIIEQSKYSGFVPVQIRTSTKFSAISVYLKSPLKTQAQFIGTARYYDYGQWMLMVDTSQIPNGEYRIFASAVLSDVKIESERRNFTVYNKPIIETVESDTTIKVESSVNEVQEVKPIIENKTIVSPKLTDSSAVNIDNKVSLQEDKVTTIDSTKAIVLSEQLKQSVPIVLKENEQKINEYLKKYSESVRKESALGVEATAEAEKAIMDTLLSDSRLGSISPEAKQRLNTEVSKQVRHAGRVELVLSKKSDKPKTADEIIREFSDILPVEEDSLVDVSSPREFGLVREDILQIESVSPVVSVDTLATTTTVYTEIRGKALPNSLVTLYIYSTPVMVTVQADSDGTFVYLYEKDLADGDHEVYVALTTNTGAVVVKSDPFQFVRTAEAFGIPNGELGDTLEPVTTNKSIMYNPYFIVFSVSILILGLVLLLLGLNMGRKQDEVVESI